MRLVHLSDPHLLRLEGVRMTDYANKRWIGRMNLLVSRGRHHRPEIFDALVDDINEIGVDHVVVTGDVTNIAVPSEFEFARERFDRLERGPHDVTVIPGNHDAYVAQGVELFAEHFDAYHMPDADWAWPDGRWPIVRLRGNVAIIGVSTSLATPWFTAYGLLGPTQLSRLASILTDPRLRDMFRVVAIHHPPAGPPSTSRIRGLRDRLELAALLAETGAELVLHGHEHRDLVSELPGPQGPIPVRGIPSSTYDAGDARRRARYRVYEIEAVAAGQRPKVVREVVRIWDPETQKAKDIDHLTPDPRIGYDAARAVDEQNRDS